MTEVLDALLIAIAWGAVSTVVAAVASLLQSARLIARLALHSEPESYVRMLVHGAEQAPVGGDLRLELQLHGIRSKSIAINSFVGPEFDGDFSASQERDGVVVTIRARHQPRPGRSWMWEIAPRHPEGGRCRAVSCVVSGKRLRRQQLVASVTPSQEPATTTRDSIHGVLFQGIALGLGIAAGIAIIKFMKAFDLVNAACLVVSTTITFAFLRSRLMPIKPFVAVGYLQGHVSIIEPDAAPSPLVLPRVSAAARAQSSEARGASYGTPR